VFDFTSKRFFWSLPPPLAACTDILERLETNLEPGGGGVGGGDFYAVFEVRGVPFSFSTPI